jgi:hypothetical protein
VILHLCSEDDKLLNFANLVDRDDRSSGSGHDRHTITREAGPLRWKRKEMGRLGLARHINPSKKLNGNAMEVVLYNGKWYSRDNRRLWCFKQSSLPSIQARISTVDHYFLKGFNTKADGWSVDFFPPVKCTSCGSQFPNRTGLQSHDKDFSRLARFALYLKGYPSQQCGGVTKESNVLASASNKSSSSQRIKRS